MPVPERESGVGGYWLYNAICVHFFALQMISASPHARSASTRNSVRLVNASVARPAKLLTKQMFVQIAPLVRGGLAALAKLAKREPTKAEMGA